MQKVKLKRGQKLNDDGFVVEHGVPQKSPRTRGRKDAEARLAPSSNDPAYLESYGQASACMAEEAIRDQAWFDAASGKAILNSHPAYVETYLSYEMNARPAANRRREFKRH